MNSQTVLIIEHDSTAGEQLASALRHRGFAALTAATYADALSIAMNTAPGLALLDDTQGEADRTRFISDLKNLSPDWECIPPVPTVSPPPPSRQPAPSEAAGIEAVVRSIRSAFQEMAETKQRAAFSALPSLSTQSVLDAVLRHASNGIFVKDTAGRYVAANPAFAQLIGHSEADLAGRRDDELQTFLADPRQAAHEHEVALGSETDEALPIGGPAPAPSHRLRRYPIFDDLGAVNGIVGIVQDMSEIRTLESKLVQAQKMEAIGLLAGGIAHDFNNILGAIVGYVELLRIEAEEGSRQKRHLSEVLKAAERASSLVKQILSFTRLHAQKITPLRIAHVLEECLRLIRASLPSSIEIVVEIEDPEGVVRIDAVQMHQVLMNLASNAGHAMGLDAGTLRFQIRETAISAADTAKIGVLRPGPYQEITVADTGCGMPPDTLEKIFEPYFTTKPETEGTGLGLSVVRNIVLAAGGNISVSSAPGEGTAFRILLPRLSEVPAEEKLHAGPLPRGSEHILYVDDEGMLADVGKKMFEKLGYAVTAETNPRDALALFRQTPDRFDLVVTDQTMPGLTGVQLAREIIRIRPDIPIVICSGFTESPEYEQAGSLGIEFFLRKPIVMKEFAETIRKVLDAGKRVFEG